ncbi:MAG TPA: D-aminoacylase [Candidatus Latescibacteria bacterium]|nr:dihydroorotase [Gemmatimonadaceae bacterium]MDP6017563.1 D-aminoacylase [Candidatus Latescibacterota bacterium]HJP30684.1 D-aminoacylase [Candidatus Latescibacterota bacterium]
MAFDTLITGCRVIDGSGNPWFRGDVALAGDRVAAVAPPGSLPPAQARIVVDGTGAVVCPGFIDIQSHSIYPLMVDGRCVSKITQGITTEIMGEAFTPAPVTGRNEGGISTQIHGDAVAHWVEPSKGWTRFAHWLEAFEAAGVSPNVGSYLGGGTLRKVALDMDDRPAGPGEQDLMRRVMAEAMEDGAFGVSYALIYPPDCYADTDEIVHVCEVVGQYDGTYITHLRSEAGEIFGALDEAFEIGVRADVPVEIYHLKAAGRDNWDKMPRVIERIEAARAGGLDVTADMYPYAASGTGLTSVLPPWAMAGGRLYENLQDPAQREHIRAAVTRPDGRWEAMVSQHGEDGVMPIGFQQAENQQYVGRKLSEICRMRGQHWFDAVCDLVLSERQSISTIYFSMTEDNLRLQLQQPWIKVSTDAGGYDPVWGKPFGPVHPRGYGTYPRVLGRFVRELNVLSLEDAVRKMTSAVADRLGLRQRGLLREGMLADVVVFDPESVTDNATFEDPHQLSRGVNHVWVNGVQVVCDGAHTGATPGRFVRPWD